MAVSFCWWSIGGSGCLLCSQPVCGSSFSRLDPLPTRQSTGLSRLRSRPAGFAPPMYDSTHTKTRHQKAPRFHIWWSIGGSGCLLCSQPVCGSSFIRLDPLPTRQSTGLSRLRSRPAGFAPPMYDSIN